jgi:hypothetical protein
VHRRWLAAYREDASVDSPQPTGPNPDGDRIITEAHAHELFAGDHSMLASGERGQALIEPKCSAFLGHDSRKTENLTSHPLIARRSQLVPERWIVSTALCPPSPT